ncbi:DUF5681 domain-containing protein [Bauldia litoralis]|uniref:DUF5681 domain-containing protein n=1 Tax=Bauldia litoralis TaxID=665467 RepID=UPI003263A4AB
MRTPAGFSVPDPEGAAATALVADTALPCIWRRPLSCSGSSFASHTVSRKDNAVPRPPKDPPYTVGYGKPPVHARFRPGQSGNPKGRKKQSRNLSTEVREALSAGIVINDGGRKKRISTQRGGILMLIQKALKGDLRALSLLLDLAGRYNDDPPPPSTDEPLSADEEAILSAYVADRLADGSLPRPNGDNGQAPPSKHTGIVGKRRARRPG